MKQFRIWIRPLGRVCRVRVEGRYNVAVVLQFLSKSFVFKTCEPVTDSPNGEMSTFLVPCISTTFPGQLGKLMANIPGVQVMNEPA
jgi:hypothetical protein